jgi:hypothetical protein
MTKVVLDSTVLGSKVISGQKSIKAVIRCRWCITEGCSIRKHARILGDNIKVVLFQMYQ